MNRYFDASIIHFEVWDKGLKPIKGVALEKITLMKIKNLENRTYHYQYIGTKFICTYKNCMIFLKKRSEEEMKLAQIPK